MMARLLACTIGLVLALAQTAGAKQIPGSTTSVAGWNLAAYADDSTGKFTHCAVSMPYRSGISLVFAVSDNYSWRVGWSHREWKLTPGQSVRIQMYFDGAGPYEVTATARTTTLVLAELSSKAAIFDVFRKSYTLTVQALGNKYGFNLDGTYAALTEVLGCTHRYVAGAQPPAPRPPVASLSPPPPMTPPMVPPLASPQPSGQPPAQSSVRSTTVPAATAEQKLEATALVANILSQGELTNFRIMSPRERREFDTDKTLESWDVVWKAESMLGTLRIIPKGVIARPTELATSVLADDSKSCRGTFASGTSPDDKNPNVVRLFTACKDEKGSFEYRYSVVPNNDGGYYLFATIGKGQAGERALTVDKADVVLRNAVFEVLKK